MKRLLAKENLAYINLLRCIYKTANLALGKKTNTLASWEELIHFLQNYVAETAIRYNPRYSKVEILKETNRLLTNKIIDEIKLRGITTSNKLNKEDKDHLKSNIIQKVGKRWFVISAPWLNYCKKIDSNKYLVRNLVDTNYYYLTIKKSEEHVYYWLEDV